MSPKRVPLRVVEPRNEGDKTGCLYCPLLPLSEDFDTTFRDKYAPGLEKAQKIVNKLDTPHTVQTRRVEEPEWNEVDILFVGEAPGSTEDREGEPFVGKAGKYLRESIEAMCETGLDRIGYTNVVRCRPPRNRDPNKTEIKCCSPQLMREIEARRPKVVITLGNKSMEYLTGHTGITSFQGSVLRPLHDELASTVTLACYHPAYVLRNDYVEDEFLATLMLADQYARGERQGEQQEGEYFILDDVDDVESLMAEFRESGRRITWDTETGDLSPFTDRFPQLLCVSFSDDEGVGYAVPVDHWESPWCDPEETYKQARTEGDLLIDQIESLRQKIERTRTKKTRQKYERQIEDLERQVDYWCEGQEARKARWDRGASDARSRVVRALNSVLEDPNIPKQAHNGKFDIEHIRRGLGSQHAGYEGDTMTAHYLVNENASHGLKVLAANYTGMAGYDNELDRYKTANPRADPEHGGSYANIRGDILFRYAAMDTDVTYRVASILDEDEEFVSNPDLRRLRDYFYPSLLQTLANIEYRGAHVEADIVRSIGQDCEENLAHVLQSIYDLPEVQQYEADVIAQDPGKHKDFRYNPGSDAQSRQILYGYLGLEPIELTDKGFQVMVDRLSLEHKRGSNKEFADIVQEARDSGELNYFSIKAAVLEEHKHGGNELSDLILQYRHYSKLNSTFVEPILLKLDSNSCVHGSFFPLTVTGRMSSSGPNLQNIPKEARRIYTSRHGDRGVMIEADYSQIELRIMACVYDDEGMIQAYREGADVHWQTGCILAGISEDEFAQLSAADQKKWRGAGKMLNFLVGYGGQAPRAQSALKEQGIMVTIDEAQKYIDKFMEGRPGLRDGLTQMHESARWNGYIDMVTGRRRRIPQAQSNDESIVSRSLRQAGNTPIQGPASDLTLLSLMAIDKMLVEGRYESEIVLTVHDSLALDAVKDELSDILPKIQRIMENIWEYAEDYLPGMDWSWLRVPLKADFSAGHSWHPSCEFDPAILDSNETSDEPLFDPDYENNGKFRDPVNADELWQILDRIAA